mmetsp:Transcript_28218/g.45316  ORF Transcript_28218/g.45316 Transcript_28218/m.45316 type:complete len:81 (+) Transcript_28218:2-244(+)
MESTGQVEAIQVSASTWHLLGEGTLSDGEVSALDNSNKNNNNSNNNDKSHSKQKDFRWRATPGVDVKGKGLMQTYLYEAA